MATGHLSLAPEADRFRQQFEELSSDADTLVAPLSDMQFRWRPQPQAWSVAECIDHLNVTARLYLPRLDEGISDAIRLGMYRAGPFRYSRLGRLFVWMLEPPPRLRFRTPAAFRPPLERPRHEIMAAFRAYQVQFVDRLRQANGLDLARARVSSPVSTWIRMPLGSAFALMISHERRHLWQARQVIERPEFPHH